LIAEFLKQGCCGIGVDGDYVPRNQLLIPEELFAAADLNTCVHTGNISQLGDQRFSLALCLEVAEHLPADASEGLVRLLTRYADVVVFSAAIPHQGGTHHVNERWPDYWISHFNKQHYHLHDILRWKIWNDTRIEPWYRQNLLLFAKEGVFPFDPASIALQRAAPTNVVHPGFWLRAVDYFSSAEHARTYPTTQLLQILLERFRSRISAILSRTVHALQHKT
jgi:hypothetical protein